jgi:succinyl-CoA synthetase beta subunit
VVVSLELLRDYGLRTAIARQVRSVDEAVRVADSIGYPVVVKTAEPTISHKSDVGGVELNMREGAAVADAFADLTTRLGNRVVVQPQAASGVELALGMVQDPVVGPLLLLAVGGTLIEVVARRSVALPPVTRRGAEGMLQRLQVDRLLAGARGLPTADQQGIVDAVLCLSQLAVELGDLIEALDVNPLVVNLEGAVAVDALVVLARPAS